MPLKMLDAKKSLAVKSEFLRTRVLAWGPMCILNHTYSQWLPEPHYFVARTGCRICGHSSDTHTLNPGVSNSPHASSTADKPAEPADVKTREQIRSEQTDSRAAALQTEVTVHPQSTLSRPFVRNPKKSFTEVAEFSNKPNECRENRTIIRLLMNTEKG